MMNDATNKARTSNKTPPQGKAMNAQKKKKITRYRIIQQNRLLILIGIGSGAMFLALTVFTLGSIHGALDDVKEAQRTAQHLTADYMQAVSANYFRIDIILDGEVIVDDGSAPNESLVSILLEWQGHFANSAGGASAQRIAELILEVRALDRSCRVFRDDNDRIMAESASAYGVTRGLLVDLRSTLDSLEGRHHTHSFGRPDAEWLNNEFAGDAPRNITEIEKLGGAIAGAKAELADLAMLSAHVRDGASSDQMDNLKDSLIASTLERLRSSLDGVFSGANEAAVDTLITRIEISLFGEGFGMDLEHQTITLGAEGLFNAAIALERSNSIGIRLLEDSNQLTTRLGNACELIDDWTGESIARVSEQVERSFNATLWRVVLAGGCITAIFLFLARKTDRYVQRQFLALSEAMGDANSLRHDLEVLTLALDRCCIVSIADVKGDITYVNDKFCEVSGYSREELIGHSHRIVKSDWHADEFYRDLWKTISSGKIWYGEIKNRCRDGSHYWVYATIAPMMNKDGKPEQYIAIRQEITTRKQLESQLAHAQKMESIGQLAAGIAHEINTPIQFVGDNIRFIRDGLDALLKVAQSCDRLLDPEAEAQCLQERSEEIKAMVDGIDLEFLLDEIPSAIDQTLGGVERVAEIVRAMKDFSHPGSEKKSLSDLNKAIESTITVCRNRWKYIANCETDFEEGLPPVPCIVGEFNQVILNIIVNAADAIGDIVGDGAGGLGLITVSTRLDGEHVEIRIRDTGGGVPEAIQKKIFDPFFTTKAVGKGTGQGLAISHDVIASKHGGTIALDVEPGVGSTFIIRMPIAERSAGVCGATQDLQQAA